MKVRISEDIKFGWDRGLKSKDLKKLRAGVSMPLNLEESLLIYEDYNFYLNSFCNTLMTKSVMNPGENRDDLVAQFPVWFKTLVISFDKNQCLKYIKKMGGEGPAIKKAFKGYFFKRLSWGVTEAHKKRYKKTNDLNEFDTQDYDDGQGESEGISPELIIEKFGRGEVAKYVFLKAFFCMPEWLLDVEFDRKVMDQRAGDMLLGEE